MKCLHVEPENLQVLFQKIEALALKFDNNLKFKMMLICEEVITNQTKHTDFENKIEDIEFCFDLQDEKTIILLFKDNAKKFNPLKKDNPDMSKNLEETEVGGLGIFMIKKYAKNLTYEYVDGYNILKVYL